MEIKKNITSIFMVPTLAIPYGKLNENGYINGYIDDLTHSSKYKNCVFVLFKPDDLDVFREFLDSEYERTKAVIEDYDYEGGFVVVVYQLDNKYKKDFKLIKQGKYSKTSKEFQKLFPKTIKIVKNSLHKEEISLQYRIFNKNRDLINFWEEKLGINLIETVGEDFELWEGWDEQKEILEINKIKETLCTTQKY
jgi:hypothetical protein